MAEDGEPDPKGDEKAKSKSSLLILAESAAAVAVLSAITSLGLNFVNRDFRNCELATGFFNDEKDPAIYDAEEWAEIKGVYLDMLMTYCDPDGGGE